jgi:hypothetical protein
MDENSQFGGMVKYVLGAVGLGAVASVFALPAPYGIWVAVAILVLFLLLFGGYFLWRRMQAKRQREQFSAALEAQTAAAPKSISDPNKRAALDKLRQKFQTGLQEFKSRGKDLYKLPWHVIIGEPGSGKSEAIRHSGIDFPPGMQDELQGSGGTVNMDWWFSNRGIILDTAGSMLFNEAKAGEAPEWREFLRLLKKARPQCPVNGLFLVLSVESLIRDSADTIAFKASRLAQQLDLIQKTLDVRFPVYLLVTKCDLLTGFREFFENIEDPILQHQIFGWSNPDPLDAHFRPDLVDQHLASIAARLRRRRMALLRETSDTGRIGETQHFFASSYQLGRGPTPSRRLDQVDAMFALPESINRLAPRLRRYLETIFVAGEWSAKPVFLRGIYFTSSLREGKALDEAIAFATGLSLDQLPEDRTWEKNRAYFLRDLFLEKVFRESGLVTRATNTLTMLRQRQLAIFGTAGAALLLLLVLAGMANHKLKKTIRNEAGYWVAGAAGWKQGAWSPTVLGGPNENLRYSYNATNVVEGTGLTVPQYHARLSELVATNLSVSWIFKPMAWMNAGNVRERAQAQRLLFEGGVLQPLVRQTRAKMGAVDPTPASLGRHKEAWLALLELEENGVNSSANSGTFANAAAPGRYLKTFLSYLTEEDIKPDTNLVNAFARTYSTEALKKNDGVWPPRNLLGGASLADNVAIRVGLEKFHKSSVTALTNIDVHLKLVDNLADQLKALQEAEVAMTNAADMCAVLNDKGVPAKAGVDRAWAALEASTNFAGGALTNLAARYYSLAAAASNASASAVSAPINLMLARLQSDKGRGLFVDVKKKVEDLASGAAENVWASYNPRARSIGLLDAAYLAPQTNSSTPSFQARWSLYTNACALASAQVKPDDNTLGDEWKQFEKLNRNADVFRSSLTNYHGPFAEAVAALCMRVARDAEQKLQVQYVGDYLKLAATRLGAVAAPPKWEPAALTNAATLLNQVTRDLAPEALARLGPQGDKLDATRKLVTDTKGKIFAAIQADLANRLGFPVLLNATQVSDISALKELRQQMAALQNTLREPIWQTGPADALTSLRARCENVSGTVNALIKEDGAPAEFELFYVPPTDASSSEDQLIVKIFRKFEVSADSTKAAIEDLTKADAKDDPSCAAGKFSLDAAFDFSFQSTGSKVQPLKTPQKWQLIRLIQSGKAMPLEDGKKWRFKVTLEEGSAKGDVTFEARLAQPLPKRESWANLK